MVFLSSAHLPYCCVLAAVFLFVLFIQNAFHLLTRFHVPSGLKPRAMELKSILKPNKSMYLASARFTSLEIEKNKLYYLLSIACGRTFCDRDHFLLVRRVKGSSEGRGRQCHSQQLHRAGPLDTARGERAGPQLGPQWTLQT